MPLLKIFDTKDAKRFDQPPTYNAEERLVHFQLPPEIKRSVSRADNDTSKVCLMVQYAYFKTNARFYPPSQFRKKDLSYAARILRCSNYDIDQYNSTTNTKHRKRILSNRGWSYFEDEHRNMLINYARRQASNQVDTELILQGLVDLCWDYRCCIPGYDELCTIITDAYNETEDEKLCALEELMDDENTTCFENLLRPGKKVGSRNQPPITNLKKIEQGVRPGQIKSALQAATVFKDLYQENDELFSAFYLSDQATKHYSTWFNKADYQQINQFSDRTKVYLHLIAFIKDQYYQRQDALVAAFKKSVRYKNFNQ